MAEEMVNIEIRDFLAVSGTSDTDYVVLSLAGGTSAKIAVGVFRSSVVSNIVPNIRDSVWWIGSTSTGVVAEGKTPHFRQGNLGIEWKYTYEPDTAWRLLVAIEDIMFTFDELTPEQRDLIKLKLSDLTEEEIAELQQPAKDMIAVLEKTNADVQQAEDARVKEFATLKEESEAATENAQDTADHPTYIGTDNYVYKWNKTVQTYDKTAIYVRGEAFSIKKVYASIDAMLADKSSTFKEGDFCLINTGDVENPDNAKLYVRSAVGSWDFLVDMSGAIGFTGKTPQMFIGTVSIGSGKDSAAVTVTPDGTDTDGNPKYRINYVIPCLAYEDLTPEQIAELQRPANEMIAVLQATDNQVKANEEERIRTEEARVEEFSRLKSESEAATTSAIAATSEANNARDAANEATEAANTATANANAATAKAVEATTAANAATTEANEARDAANEAAGEALGAASTADASAQRADESSIKADTATENANIATANATKATEDSTAATDAARVATTEANNARDAANEATEAANTATANANTAADEARHLPKIQDGTWWLYDVDSDSYVDSGYAVSSDFQLTKEKIENVFTGNIVSHWHDRYVDKVEGKQLSTEDFTTILKEKLDGLSNYDDTEISQAVEKLRSDFDELVSGDTTTAIKTFNEVIDFLDGLKDTEDLASIITSIEQQIAAKYTKPSTGIPKTDLASAVQTSLGKADTALQSYTEQYKGTVTGVKMNGSTKDPSSGVVDLGTVITAHQDLSGYQPKLVSGTNIKTINGTSILGSGDITIETGLSESEVDNRIAEAITTVLNTEV